MRVLLFIYNMFVLVTQTRVINMFFLGGGCCNLLSLAVTSAVPPLRTPKGAEGGRELTFTIVINTIPFSFFQGTGRIRSQLAESSRMPGRTTHLRVGQVVL